MIRSQHETASAAAGFRARRNARRRAQFGSDAAQWYGSELETGSEANGEFESEVEDEFSWIPGFDRLRAAVSAIPSYLGVVGSTPPAPAMAPGSTAPVATPVTVPTAVTGSGHLKDHSHLRVVALAPATPVAIDPAWSKALRAMAQTYNRLGGLMQAVATQLGIEVPAVLAVWRVESGGRTHVPNQAIIRFENHLLYRRWGTSNRSVYDQYFRHGGHAGNAGNSWENHQYRENTSASFRTLHTGKQEDEYRALQLATRLAGETHAVQCISIGGPQILVSNHSLIGYATPRAMFDAFQTDERYHVLGFFDFCRNRQAPLAGDLIKYLRARNWSEFARYYNGPGQVDTYGRLIGDAFAEAQKLPIGSREFELWEDNQDSGDAGSLAEPDDAMEPDGVEPYNAAEPYGATKPMQQPVADGGLSGSGVSDAALQDLLRRVLEENRRLRDRLKGPHILQKLRRDVERLARQARPIGTVRNRRTGRRLPVYQARAGRRTYNLVAGRGRGGRREIMLVTPTADAT